MNRESHSQGTPETNRTGQSIVVLVGNTEEPTPAAIDAVNECIQIIREQYDTVEEILGHRDAVNTPCPGEILYGMVQDGTFSLDNGNGNGGDPDPGNGNGDPDPDPGDELEVDGRAGVLTISELQRRLGVTVDGRAAEQTWSALQDTLGTPVDGVVSAQSYEAVEVGNGIVPRAWLFTGRGSSGSTMVRALQEQLSITVDGIWFEATTAALQTRLNEDSSFPS